MEWGSIEMGVAQKVFGIAQLGWSVAQLGWNVDQMGWSVAQLGWTVAHQGWIELNRYGVQLNWDGVYISWHDDMYTLLKYKIQDLEKAKTDLKTHSKENMFFYFSVMISFFAMKTLTRQLFRLRIFIFP